MDVTKYNLEISFLLIIIEAEIEKSLVLTWASAATNRAQLNKIYQVVEQGSNQNTRRVFNSRVTVSNIQSSA